MTHSRKPLLTLADLTADEILAVGEVAQRYGAAPQAFAGQLKGTRLGMVFTAPSTRTRASFWSAARTLGCDVLHFGAGDLQQSTGETWGDTGVILSAYLDAVVVRTNGPQYELEALARTLPATVNALTYADHPTQAVADLCAMSDHFEDIRGLRVAYLGVINNTARALAHLLVKLPFGGLDIYGPDGSGFAAEELVALQTMSAGATVRQFGKMPEAPDPVDIVYTTRWHSMGATRPEPDWVERFAPFAVSAETMARFSGDRPAVFMHDLPAVRDQEAASEVIDGLSAPSIVLRQVHHKASAAAAALLWATGRI